MTPDTYGQFEENAMRDVSWLQQHNIMDYSLLLGVQNESYAVSEELKMPASLSIGGIQYGSYAKVLAPTYYFYGIIDFLQVRTFSCYQRFGF